LISIIGEWGRMGFARYASGRKASYMKLSLRGTLHYNLFVYLDALSIYSYIESGCHVEGKQVS